MNGRCESYSYDECRLGAQLLPALTLSSMGCQSASRLLPCASAIITSTIYCVCQVLWRCWLGSRKGIRPVKKTEWWGAGMVICLQRGADLHMAQLMPLPLTVSCFSKIQIGFTLLVPAHPGSPGKRAVKRVYVCVCVKMTSVCVELGSPPGFCARLHWAGAGGDAIAPLISQACRSYHHPSRLRSQQIMSSDEYPPWQEIVVSPTTR